MFTEVQLAPSLQISDSNLLLDHREVALPGGAKAFLTKGYAREGAFLQRGATFGGPQAIFNFCLKGRQRMEMTTGNYRPANADPGHFNALLVPREHFTEAIEATGEFAAVTFHLPLDRYLAMLGESSDRLPANFKRACEATNICYFKDHEWQPRIRQVLHELLHGQWSPLAERIFWESKMLELVAVFLEMGHRASDGQRFLPKRDEERMRHARQILEQDLANPPSLARLARLIGSNEFALKKGFKAVFGEPVYQFLQKARMEQALETLRSTDLSVAEVAASVGYENQSAFTRAFRQGHGLLPSEVRNR